MTEADLTLALSKKYCPPEYAFLSQVRSTTGYNRKIRTMDAMAVSCYPSRGIFLHGFEVKVSRSDWLREMKDPEKAEEIGRHCHYFSVVAPEGIVKRDELPAKWGLIVATDKGISVAKAGILVENHRTLPVDFVASVLRKASESMVPMQSMEAQIEESVKERLGQRIDSVRFDNQMELDRLKRLQSSVEAFQKASGVNIDIWDGGNIGAAVRRLRTIRSDISGSLVLKQAIDRLNSIREEAEKYLAIVESVGSLVPEREGDE